MTASTKPRSALLAYCALADRLNKPGAGIAQALTPFLAEVCRPFAGEFFDAAMFSAAVSEKYGIRIPRLAALGLAEHLEKEGLLTAVTSHAKSTAYRYAPAKLMSAEAVVSSVTEAEIDAVLNSFVEFCRADAALGVQTDTRLHSAFFERLLNVDSMRLLSRREMSNAAKKGSETLLLKKPVIELEPHEREELHLDFLVSQYLLDLRDSNPTGFERVSDIAFANMAAEALAVFREPLTEQISLSTLTVYLDSPLLLDMLGVNTEYSDYGQELLRAIKSSGATPAVFDHCVAEAESVVGAQLARLRSGINQMTNGWGTSAKPDLLSALVGCVGARASNRLGIAVQRDPEVNLHRRSPVAVGDIEADLVKRMQAWRNADSRDHDRKSVWAMLAIRDTTDPCTRICDSRFLLLTRNTALVHIANDAWTKWLKGATRHSQVHIEKWAPVAMSDKQFAGYLWLRSGGSDGAMSKARLLAHCSAAVRPRSDIKARAYNLVLELSNRQEADDVAALLEDREGARALMRATSGDPEDVTKERLPYILEQVRLAAGEFAAAKVREEGQQQLDAARAVHATELEQVRRAAGMAQALQDAEANRIRQQLIQQDQDAQRLAGQNVTLQAQLAANAQAERARQSQLLQEAFQSGRETYRALRWAAALAFGLLSGAIAWLANREPALAAAATVLLGTLGFWFVPDFLDRPMQAAATKRMRAIVAAKDKALVLPTQPLDFKQSVWGSPEP